MKQILNKVYKRESFNFRTDWNTFDFTFNIVMASVVLPLLGVSSLHMFYKMKISLGSNLTANV